MQANFQRSEVLQSVKKRPIAAMSRKSLRLLVSDGSNQVAVLPFLISSLSFVVKVKAIKEVCEEFRCGKATDYWAKYEAKAIIKASNISKGLPKSIANALLDRVLAV